MKAPTIDKILVDLAKSVLASPNVNSPRGMKVKELYDVGFKLENARNSVINNPVRAFHKPYAVIEMLGLFQQSGFNIEPYIWYCPNMKSYLNPKTGLWDGSYADRLVEFKQVEEMYKILKNDPDSRRAVIQLYMPHKDFHEEESLDIPCTLSLVFRLREGKLNLTSTMRSNDIYLGLGFDMTQFTFIQNVLASALGVEVGSIYHFVANMHAYERDWPTLQRIAGGEWGEMKNNTFTKMPKWDIPDLRETKLQIRRFFLMELEVRDLCKKGEKVVSMPLMFDRYKITSKFLRNIFLDVLFPYILKKT